MCVCFLHLAVCSPASAVFGPLQQNQVHSFAADCSDCLYKERGNLHCIYMVTTCVFNVLLPIIKCVCVCVCLLDQFSWGSPEADGSGC